MQQEPAGDLTLIRRRLLFRVAWTIRNKRWSGLASEENQSTEQNSDTGPIVIYGVLYNTLSVALKAHLDSAIVKRASVSPWKYILQKPLYHSLHTRIMAQGQPNIYVYSCNEKESDA